MTSEPIDLNSLSILIYCRANASIAKFLITKNLTTPSITYTITDLANALKHTEQPWWIIKFMSIILRMRAQIFQFVRWNIFWYFFFFLYFEKKKLFKFEQKSIILTNICDDGRWSSLWELYLAIVSSWCVNYES